MKQAFRIKRKINLGFHIPYENCDECKNKCERQNEDHSKMNSRRKKIVEYLKQMSIDVYTYNSLSEMYSALGFTTCFIDNETGKSQYFNDILLIDRQRDSNELIICTIGENEEKWYVELQKEGKIDYIQKHCMR